MFLWWHFMLHIRLFVPSIHKLTPSLLPPPSLYSTLPFPTPHDFLATSPSHISKSIIAPQSFPPASPPLHITYPCSCLVTPLHWWMVRVSGSAVEFKPAGSIDTPPPTPILLPSSLPYLFVLLLLSPASLMKTMSETQSCALSWENSEASPQHPPSPTLTVNTFIPLWDLE